MPNLSPTIAGDCIVKPALFLQDSDSWCVTQMTVDADGCLSRFFDATNYYDPKLLLLGTADSFTSGFVNVNLAAEHYKISNTGVITTLADTDIQAPTFDDAAECSCTNFLRQAHYTINYEERDDDQFYPVSAEVSFVLGDVEVDKVGGNCESVENVGQKFVYRYVQDGGDPPIYQSGNPGYIDKKPLVLGLRNGDVIDRNINGVKLLT